MLKVNLLAHTPEPEGGGRGGKHVYSAHRRAAGWPYRKKPGICGKAGQNGPRAPPNT